MDTSKYKLLQGLLPYIEDYENNSETQQPSVDGFAEWLNIQLAEEIELKHGEMDKDFSKQQYFSPDESAEIEISTLISHLYKFTKHYSKKILDSTVLSTLEDFGFMATLMQGRGMSRTELIGKHVIEFTSGTEVIKRLKKHELIEESRDTRDKRCKILSITDKGHKLMLKVFAEMNNVAFIVNGNLTSLEKKILLKILQKLTSFHMQIYDNDWKKPINEIIEKYVIPKKRTPLSKSGNNSILKDKNKN